MEESIEKEEIIYHWIVPEDHPDYTGIDDLAKEYRVIKCDKAMAGCIIEGKYSDGKWQRPWTLRPLVKHLIDELNKLKLGKDEQ